MSVLIEAPDGMVDVLERLCKLSEDVHREIVGYEHASDCFCTRGGVWRFDGERFVNRHWCHGGQTVDFIERAVRLVLDHPEILHLASVTV